MASGRMCPPSLLGGLLCLLLLFGCSGEEPLRIGFAGQLAGKYADLGVAGRNGAALAVEDLNVQGGIAGRHVELLVADDHNTPQGAVEADTWLLDQGVAGIVGHMTSSQTLAALPLLQERGAVLVSPTTSTSLLSGIRDNFFRVQVATDYNARGLGAFASRQQGVLRMCLLQDTGNKAYVDSFATAFAEAFVTLGGEIVWRKELNGLAQSGSQASPDWPILLRQAVAQGCEALCIVAPARATAMMAQHGKRMGLAMPVFSSGLARTWTLVEQGGRSVDGIFMTNSVNSDSQGFMAFSQRYEERFGTEALFAAVRAYEAVMLLAEGMRRSQDGPQSLLQALQGIRAIPGIDSTITLDKYGDCRRPSFILQVQGGEFVNIAVIEPEEMP